VCAQPHSERSAHPPSPSGGGTYDVLWGICWPTLSPLKAAHLKAFIAGSYLPAVVDDDQQAAKAKEWTPTTLEIAEFEEVMRFSPCTTHVL
jgi:hypothetical protein